MREYRIKDKIVSLMCPRPKKQIDEEMLANKVANVVALQLHTRYTELERFCVDLIRDTVRRELAQG